MTTRAGFRVLFHLGTADPRTSVKDLVDLYHGPISTRPARRRGLREVLTHLDPDDLVEVEEGLGQVRCPALVLWGEKDVSGPLAVARQLHRGLPASTLRTISGCGHFAPEDAPDQVGELLLAFLLKYSATSPRT